MLLSISAVLHFEMDSSFPRYARDHPLKNNSLAEKVETSEKLSFSTDENHGYPCQGDTRAFVQPSLENLLTLQSPSQFSPEPSFDSFENNSRPISTTSSTPLPFTTEVFCGIPVPLLAFQDEKSSSAEPKSAVFSGVLNMPSNGPNLTNYPQVSTFGGAAIQLRQSETSESEESGQGKPIVNQESPSAHFSGHADIRGIKSGNIPTCPLLVRVTGWPHGTTRMQVQKVLEDLKFCAEILSSLNGTADSCSKKIGKNGHGLTVVHGFSMVIRRARGGTAMNEENSGRHAESLPASTEVEVLLHTNEVLEAVERIHGFQVGTNQLQASIVPTNSKEVAYASAEQGLQLSTLASSSTSYYSTTDCTSSVSAATVTQRIGGSLNTHHADPLRIMDERNVSAQTTGKTTMAGTSQALKSVQPMGAGVLTFVSTMPGKATGTVVPFPPEDHPFASFPSRVGIKIEPPNFTDDLKQQQKVSTVVLRLRGLPFTCSDEDLHKFLKPVEGIVAVRVCRCPEGKCTGDAFVEISSGPGEGQLRALHGKMMGRRYIEVLRSTVRDASVLLRSAALKGRTYTKGSHGRDHVVTVGPMISQDDRKSVPSAPCTYVNVSSGNGGCFPASGFHPAARYTDIPPGSGLPPSQSGSSFFFMDPASSNSSQKSNIVTSKNSSASCFSSRSVPLGQLENAANLNSFLSASQPHRLEVPPSSVSPGYSPSFSSLPPASHAVQVSGLPPFITPSLLVEIFRNALVQISPERVFLLTCDGKQPTGDAVLDFQDERNAKEATAKLQGCVVFNQFALRVKHILWNRPVSNPPSLPSQSSACVFYPQMPGGVKIVSTPNEMSRDNSNNELYSPKGFIVPAPDLNQNVTFFLPTHSSAPQ